MFRAGRSSLPTPAPRSLEDLDSVQRVLFHRSVRGGDGRGPRVQSPTRAPPREGVGTCTPPFPASDAPAAPVSPLGLGPENSAC
ncbi:hypothetical protein VULLAG_LOCUS19597 [Vulpes lagopus]